MKTLCDRCKREFEYDGEMEDLEMTDEGTLCPRCQADADLEDEEDEEDN